MGLLQMAFLVFVREIKQLLCEQRGPSIEFFNPAIPTGIFPQSRNPDGFYQLIPIPVIFSEVLTSTKTILEVPFQITIRFN